MKQLMPGQQPQMTEMAEILYYQRDRASQKIISDLVATHILERSRKTLDRCILKGEVQIILKTKKGFNLTSRENLGNLCKTM